MIESSTEVAFCDHFSLLCAKFVATYALFLGKIWFGKFDPCKRFDILQLCFGTHKKINVRKKRYYFAHYL